MAKFMVDYTFQGRSSCTIEAESLDAAKAKIEAEVNKDDFEIDADEIDDVRFDIQEMHPITRDGRELWTTYIRKDDVRGHQSALSTSPLFAVAVA
ncbi:hypothetical protein GGE68_002973 [Rhizobium leguminosarum]|uniref:hypothetical protein n=1 Tax=Rhizobium leguminosarum TaxID=384 RepID=UPI0016091E18|nr:hypothetical protein [Rhizobium leguminosarum]MBB5664776.1 hypothetical protein [Rhizobium leguminosarum]